MENAHENSISEQEIPSRGIPFSILARFIVVSLMAALFGGLIWGTLALGFDSESSYIAIGIGALCGYIASLFMSVYREVIFPALAVLFSIVGGLLGKYILYLFFIAEITSIPGETTIDAIQLIRYYILEISVSQIPAFFLDFEALFDFYDFLFAILMVGTAWRVSYAKIRKTLKNRPNNRRIRRTFS